MDESATTSAGRCPSRRWTWVPVLVLLLGAAPGDDAGSARELGERDLMARYVADPAAHHDEVLARAGGDPSVVPTPLLLALADARLRDGDLGAAGGALAAVAARQPSPPWDGWAELGLGWIAVASGDLASAREHYARVPASGATGDAAVLMLALLDDGDGSEAAGRLDALAAAPETAPRLRPVAMVAAGYARWWAGDFDGAAVAFDAAAARYADEPLADDARYAAAIARFRAGRRAEAEASLHALAAVSSDARAAPRVSPGSVALSRRAVLGAGLRRYGGPVRAPEEQLVALLDLDGSALARAAVARMDDPDGPLSADVDVQAVRQDPAESLEPTRVVAETNAAPGERELRIDTVWPYGLVAALGLALVLAGRRRLAR